MFDPTQSTSLAHAVWSPLSASTTWPGARRTAAALLGTADGRSGNSSDDSFWRPAGARYLAALLFAAQQAANMTMADVLHWIAISDFKEPAELLDDTSVGVPTPALDAIISVRDADLRFSSSLLQTIATALDAWPGTAGCRCDHGRLEDQR